MDGDGIKKRRTLGAHRSAAGLARLAERICAVRISNIRLRPDRPVERNGQRDVWGLRSMGKLGLPVAPEGGCPGGSIRTMRVRAPDQTRDEE